MRKILPFLVIGILVLGGLGAGALQIDKEKLELKTIESNTPVKEGREFTHTVLAEFGTTSSCPHCPPVSGYLYDIQGSGEYDFYFITLNADKESLANARYWEIPGASGSVPQVFFDGGYSTLIGNQGSKTPYISKIVQSGARNVPDIDLNVAVNWLGAAEIEVTVGVTNNEGSSYTGHLHAYVTEIVSRWYDNSGKKYHYSMIGYAFNENINVGAGNTWSDTAIWDGDSHPPYGNIQEDNIMVIVSIFDPSNKYSDETAAATPGGGGTNNPPEVPNIDGTTNGNAGTKYTYTFNSVDPDGDNVFYYVKWGDGHTEVWDGPHASGVSVNIDHTYTKEGTFTIEAKANDIYNEESGWASLTVTMPRTKSISNTFLLNILKQISQTFPIFNKILNL